MRSMATVRGQVLSTHVEVVRTTMQLVNLTPRALHARGGGPLLREGRITADECSPRTWRWSALFGWGVSDGSVLSTHVEVVPGDARSDARA